ncbi:hypothetical protein BaRGS_00019729 [Batillaria attramentaria]|uniref:Hydroxylysine kinase n=1 Tax=Batillaria attramentaria TaxID=370345 RepID=A0ABD0KP87_9CAEN
MSYLPEVTTTEVGQILLQHYRLHVKRVIELESYYCRNLSVTAVPADKTDTNNVDGVREECDKRYVLKVFSAHLCHRQPTTLKQIKVSQFLLQRGFVCPDVIHTTQGALLAELGDGRLAELMTLLPGKQLEADKGVITATVLYELGVVLAVMHQTLQDGSMKERLYDIVSRFTEIKSGEDFRSVHKGKSDPLWNTTCTFVLKGNRGITESVHKGKSDPLWNTTCTFVLKGNRGITESVHKGKSDPLWNTICTFVLKGNRGITESVHKGKSDPLWNTTCTFVLKGNRGITESVHKGKSDPLWNTTCTLVLKGNRGITESVHKGKSDPLWNTTCTFVLKGNRGITESVHKGKSDPLWNTTCTFVLKGNRGITESVHKGKSDPLWNTTCTFVLKGNRGITESGHFRVDSSTTPTTDVSSSA